MTRALTLQPIHLAVAREFVAAHHHIKGFATLRFPPDRRGIDNEDRDAREAKQVRPGVP